MWGNSNGDRLRSLNMPSYIGGDFQVAGTKIINANPSNIKSGLPRASGFTIVFDVNTADGVSGRDKDSLVFDWMKTLFFSF